MAKVRKLTIIVLAFGCFWATDPGQVLHGSWKTATAEAIIGRPATPASYAGVARRTTRRCAVGVYYC
jgi:hypothetical protein